MPFDLDKHKENVQYYMHGGIVQMIFYADCLDALSIIFHSQFENSQFSIYS